MNVSSARPTYRAWPLPRNARSSWSGSATDWAPIATEPSKLATVRRNASVSPTPSPSRRLTSVGMTLASVVTSAAMPSESVCLRSA